MSDRLRNRLPRSASYSPQTGSCACAYPLADEGRPRGMKPKNHSTGGLAWLR